MSSGMSSVTLSRALSVDRHDHSGQGFYVATRLGDFVEVPNGLNGEIDAPMLEESEEDIFLDDVEAEDTDADATTLQTDLQSGGDITNEDSTKIVDDEIDLVSDITAPVAVAGKVEEQIAPPRGSAHKDVESDLIAALVPECGVPIPSVVAKVSTSSSKRVRSGKGGMLLPWHSTRSIQNYHGRRGSSKKNHKGGSNSSLYSTGRSGMFSIGSVHTFRG